MKRILILQLLLVLMMFFTASTVYAHRVNIFAWVDGDMVRTQSKFSGGRTVNEGRVNVYDMNGNLLLKGTTDGNGEFSFKIPQKTALRIELQAGMGHQNEWIIHENEIGKLPEAESVTASDHPEVSVDNYEHKAVEMTSTDLNREELRQIIEDSVERQLKPVIKMLADQSDQTPGISEILGGIGYIIGLVGIAAFFKSRNKRDVGTR